MLFTLNESHELYQIYWIYLELYWTFYYIVLFVLSLGYNLFFFSLFIGWLCIPTIKFNLILIHGAKWYIFYFPKVHQKFYFFFRKCELLFRTRKGRRQWWQQKCLTFLQPWKMDSKSFTIYDSLITFHFISWFCMKASFGFSIY